MTQPNSATSENYPTEELQERLNDLEMRLLFQDDLLNTLNEVVIRQDQEILKLWDANRLLKQSMHDMKDSNEAIVDIPPPHY